MNLRKGALVLVASDSRVCIILSAGLFELHSEGSRGVGLGAMDYLRGFPSTAPLVRMILVIARDVVGALPCGDCPA